MVKYTLKYPKSKRSSIKMQINAFSQRYFIPTGVNTETKEWNAKAQRVRQTTANATDSSIINNTLDKLEAAAKHTIAKFKALRGVPSSEEFRKAFDLEYKGKPKPKEKVIPSFTRYMETYIERYRLTKSYNTTRSITTIYNKLVAYEKQTRTKITFKGIDMALYAKLSAYFASQGYRDSYFASAVKVIKQVYREAREVDKLHSYDGIGAKGFSASSGEVDNIYLTEAELQRIYDLDISLSYLQTIYAESRDSDILRKVQSLCTARAFFLLGAYTGLRVSDFTRLKEANISDYIRIRTLKTNKEVIIPIHPIVREIIDGDIDITAPPSAQRLNDAIKELARLSGLTSKVEITSRIGGSMITETKERWELVSSHTARRSFATNAYKSGVPTLAIMKITGHTKESTFMKYIKISGEENAEVLAAHPFFNKK